MNFGGTGNVERHKQSSLPASASKRSRHRQNINICMHPSRSLLIGGRFFSIADLDRFNRIYRLRLGECDRWMRLFGSAVEDLVTPVCELAGHTDASLSHAKVA